MLTTLKEWFFRRKFKKRVFKKKLVIADGDDENEDPTRMLNAFSYSYGDRIAQSTEQKKEKAEHSQVDDHLIALCIYLSIISLAHRLLSYVLRHSTNVCTVE